jgi:hypothetical protein
MSRLFQDSAQSLNRVFQVTRYPAIPVVEGLLLQKKFSTISKNEDLRIEQLPCQGVEIVIWINKVLS